MGEGFRKRSRPGQWKDVGLARISYDDLGRAYCSCGWSFGHLRTKVRENAVDRHLHKRHEGRGIRL